MSKVSPESQAVGVKDGRPSEFKEEYIEKVDEYLEENQDSVERELGSTNERTGRERFERVTTVKLPTIEGFALFLGVAKSTLYDWEEKSQDFSYALDKIREEQRKRLLNKGLSGEYNSTIAKLILSSNHGYKEKSDVTSDDKEIQGVVVLPAKDES
jgi:DNA-binding transcriptional regulator YiaG